MRLLNLSGGVDVALLILQPATEDRAPTDSGERIRWPLNSRNPQETVRNPQRNRARDFRKFAGGPGTMGVERCQRACYRSTFVEEQGRRLRSSIGFSLDARR